MPTSSSTVLVDAGGAPFGPTVPDVEVYEVRHNIDRDDVGRAVGACVLLHRVLHDPGRAALGHYVRARVVYGNVTAFQSVTFVDVHQCARATVYGEQSLAGSIAPLIPGRHGNVGPGLGSRVILVPGRQTGGAGGGRFGEQGQERKHASVVDVADNVPVHVVASDSGEGLLKCGGNSGPGHGGEGTRSGVRFREDDGLSVPQA